MRTELQEQLLRDLERLVMAESKTGDIEAIEACAELLIEIGNRILFPHAQATKIETSEGPIVTWRFGDVSRFALIGHYDTVFPRGSVEGAPFVVDGDTVRGLGTYDMKAGLLVALYASAEVLAHDPHALDGVIIFCDPDEEDGSKVSRSVLAQLVEEGLERALVFEGGKEHGHLCNERKGALWVELTFTGSAAHASTPELGSNAIAAMSEYVNNIRNLAAEIGPDVSVVPTMVQSGEAINAVPAKATVIIDSRQNTAEEQQRLFDYYQQASTTVPGVDVSLEVLYRFPAMPADASQKMVEQIQQICEDANVRFPGMSLSHGITDASHLAALGIEVVDGFGPAGGNDHSPDEWCSLSSVFERIELVKTVLPKLL